THNQRIVGELLALGDQRTGANQTVPTDAGAVEHNGAHADQTVLADGAAMQYGTVTDSAAAPDRQRKSGIGVHDRVFLDIGVGTDDDRLIIAARDDAEPDGNIAPNRDVADQGGVRRHPVAWKIFKARRLAVERVNRHLSSF